MSMVIQCFFLLSKLTSEFCTCCICVLNLPAVNFKLFVDTFPRLRVIQVVVMKVTNRFKARFSSCKTVV